MRTPTNPFEAAGTVEVFVPKEIIARRIQDIFAGPNKGRKADHYLVVWEGYPLKKDYTWEPIENLYGHEDLAQTYEQWLKTENERLDSVEAERKTARKMTAQKVQDVAADQFRKNDKFTKKAKGTDKLFYNNKSLIFFFPFPDITPFLYQNQNPVNQVDGRQFCGSLTRSVVD